ncbi:MAG TPA: DUF1707 domain-containing protein [Streptosporangiaceae bacterium]|nr:DUF1707 domain-containing protein [Streptosporangiaceae bacterium]
MRGDYTSRRRPDYPDPGLRVSDAERADVADRLAKHYGDGRLDQSEFEERVDRAMKAKTHGDLSGLFTDLPDTGGPDMALKDREPAREARPPRERHGRPLHRLVFLAFIVFVTIVVAHALTGGFVGPFFVWHAFAWSFFPWLWVALLVFVWLRYRRRHRP